MTTDQPPGMTTAEFLTALASVADKFEWTRVRSVDKTRPDALVLRGWRRHCWYCPLTAVARVKLKKRYPPSEWEAVGIALGLHTDDALDLAEAADGVVNVNGLNAHLVTAVMSGGDW